MSAASLFRVGLGRFGLRCAYHAGLVADLKRISAWARSYDPATRVWTFDRGQLDRVWHLCETHLGDVHVDPELEPPPPRRAPDSRLELLGKLIAPLSEVGLKRVYRVVMDELHPDRGGDTRTCQEANATWDAISRQRRGGR